MSLSSRSIKPFLIALATYLIFMELVPTLFLAHIHVPQKSDFSCFYAAGVLARTEPTHLYDVGRQMNIQMNAVGPENGWAIFIQPPYEALFLAPFSLLSYQTSYLIYLALNVVLLLPCFLLARDAFSNVLDPWQPRPGLLFFFFLPLPLALLQGQASIRLLLLCCAAWYELKKGRDFGAGLLIALGLFKLQLVVPLVLLLGIWRGTRILFGFATGALALAGISCWLVGVRGMQTFGSLLVASSLVKRETQSDIATTGQLPLVMPNLRGLLYGCGGRYLPHTWLLGLTLVLSVALLLWTAYLLRKQPDPATAFALATIAALLLSYHLHTHDLTVLLLPIALLAGRVRPYFGAVVTTCFLLPVLLLVRLGQAHYLMAVPLVAFFLLIALERKVNVSAAPALELAMQ